MNKILIIFFAILFCFAVESFSQIPTDILLKIVRAEDERRFDETLEDLIKSRSEKIRARAALAAGRIGDERAVAPLADLLERDASAEVRVTAAFALGEVESLKAAGVILKILANEILAPQIRARLTEAAGKIAAANNAKSVEAINLGEAILDVLEAEAKNSKPDRLTVLLGLTAVLRARPEGGEAVAAKFLTNLDARIRADAANALSRIRAKKANAQLRAMLLADEDAVARANAARALGAAEDKDAFDLLLEAATTDEDSRVRVSAIRSLGNLKNARAADKLSQRGEILLKKYTKEFYAAAPAEKNELLEIAAALGRILPNSNNERALNFLHEFGAKDAYNSSEIHIAVARISASNFLKIEIPKVVCGANYAKTAPSCWRFYSGQTQGFSEFANLDVKDALRGKAADILREQLKSYIKRENALDRSNEKAIPDALRAFAKFKTSDLPELARVLSKFKDISIRAAAAEILGELPADEENVYALKKAFESALITDKDSNDAQLAIISALVKLDKQQSIESLKLALDVPDYLVRRHAAQLIKENDLAKELPDAAAKVGTVKIYNPLSGSKLGQILNTDADYRRAVSRRNARAILVTEKGAFTIEFFPEAAPLTIDNFIKLAKARYFDGLAIHRVVPNFVVQDGDPSGDGNGGPGWQIRCELNMLFYERGAVGMALSGKDTGGSQWFVTHSPQPHLDGGYTIFGKVNESDMKVVDELVRGDKILNVRIVEGKLPVRSTKGGKK